MIYLMYLCKKVTGFTAKLKGLLNFKKFSFIFDNDNWCKVKLIKIKSMLYAEI